MHTSVEDNDNWLQTPAKSREDADPILGYHLLAAAAKGSIEQLKDLLSNGR